MKTRITLTSLVAIVALTGRKADAVTVWNVNVGSATSGAFEITTVDNYIGAATENTANSTWNAVGSVTTNTLADSTGSTSAGVTLSFTEALPSTIDFGNQSATIGDEIFKTWIKDNSDPYSFSFGNLNNSLTYSLVVYTGWVFGPDLVSVTQTAGSGLTGAFNINSLDMEPGNPLAMSLAQDTNAGNNPGNTNYARFDGLTTDGSGNLTFRIGGLNGVGGVDAPINGFQLVGVPEPSSALMLGLAGLLLARRRR